MESERRVKRWGKRGEARVSGRRELKERGEKERAQREHEESGRRGEGE
jgi:hypothetical protein